MKIPKSFVPKKNLDDKTMMFLKEEPKLEKRIEEGIIIERPEKLTREERGRKWLLRVGEYIDGLDLPENIRIKKHDWFYGTWSTNPPCIELSEEKTITVKERPKYFPLFKIKKNKIRLDTIMFIRYEDEIHCEKKEYEYIALDVAKKFNMKRIQAWY